MEYAGFHNQDICTSATQMSSPANVSVFPIVIHKTEQNVRICKKWNIKYLGKKCNYQHLKKITATFLKGCLLGADWKELFHSYFLLHRCFLRLHHLPTAVRRWLWESWPFAGPKGRLNPWCCSHRNSCFLVQICWHCFKAITLPGYAWAIYRPPVDGSAATDLAAPRCQAGRALPW